MADYTSLGATAVVASSFGRQGSKTGLPQENILVNGTFKTPFSKISGVEEVATTAMSFWLTKYSLIKQYGTPLEYGNGKTTDISWSEMMRDKGYKIIVDWSISTKHWYKDKEGIVNFYDKSNSKEVKTKIRVKMPRRSSPLFWYVEEGTDVEKLKVDYIKSLIK